MKWYSKSFFEFARKLGVWNTFWDRWYKPVIVKYNARGLGKIDIRHVFRNTAEGDLVLNNLVKEKEWRDLDNDMKPFVVATYVNKRLTYRTDQSNFSKPEMWQSPYDVWKKKSDDCDGFAVLICDFLIKSGVPPHRVYVAGGDTIIGGHAYVLYLRESDNQWYSVEGSLYPKESMTKYLGFVPHRLSKVYGRVWWVTNFKESRGMHDTEAK